MVQPPATSTQHLSLRNLTYSERPFHLCGKTSENFPPNGTVRKEKMVVPLWNQMVNLFTGNRDLKQRQRRRQQECQKTIVLISKTLALYVHYKQRREMTTFNV